MILSLNEIEVNLRKAAIGAGLPLGCAEDLGRAAAWLAVFQLPAVPLCLEALACLRAGAVGRPALAVDGAGIRCLHSDGDRALSSLYAGPAAADLLLAATAEGALPATFGLDATDSPLLVWAAVCDPLTLRRELTLTCRLRTPDGEVAFAELNGGKVSFAEDTKRPDPRCPLTLTLSVTSDDAQSASGQDFFACQTRAAEYGITVEDADWQRVQKLVAETLVPASELSRLQGAGAGLRDND